MEFKVTSRKDDLISLVYMMLFILNDFALPGINDVTFRQLSNDEDSHAVFTEIKEHKKNMTLYQMS
jgi:hypothetical protein